MKRYLNSVFLLFLAVLFGNVVYGQEKAGKAAGRKNLKYGPLHSERRADDAMEAFRDYGFGQFIHWGLYAIPGNEWEGVSARKGAAASEWIRAWSGPTKPVNWTQTYDNLYKQFNPVDFDAKRWARQAKAMGARYLIFTTKHHDGFALWPTQYSDYNSSNTPFKRDIVKEVVDAYTAEGIDVYLYFSVLDWHHPDYQSKNPATADEEKKFANFLNYTRNQLLELLHNYPQLKGFWFDGTWDPSWVKAYDFTYKLEKEMRDLHPGLIIGSRFRSDEYGKRHFDSNGQLLGDYEQGWERKLPADYSVLKGNDWDAVMTIPPNGWGYMKDWTGLYTKTKDDLLSMLMRTVSMDGNFVLNFGPDGKGNMHPGEDKLAKEIGDWMRINSEAVYATHQVSWPTLPYGYLTRKGDYVYLTVFNRPINEQIRLLVPKVANERPQAAHLLVDGRELKLAHADIGLDRDANTYYDIQLPSDFQSNEPFVLKVKVGLAEAKEEKLMDAKK